MYERILVPVDSSLTSEAGLQEAIRLARGTGARLRLLHVVDLARFNLSFEGWSNPAPDLAALLREGGEHVLRAAAVTCEAADVAADSVLIENPSGRVAQRVVEHAAQWPASLIVLGTHGEHAVGRLLLGNTAQHIVAGSAVPVLLVPTRVATDV